MLCKENNGIATSISSTTRAPRKGERCGEDYIFLSEFEFMKRVVEGEFLEYAQVFGNYYGTSKQSVLTMLEKGIHVLLVIDTQGALALKKIIPAQLIFIDPPSIDELKKRLVSRNSESLDVIEHRLSCVSDEMKASNSYDYRVLNQNLSETYNVLRSIIVAEEHKIRR
jgi:guanylate kinase